MDSEAETSENDIILQQSYNEWLCMYPRGPCFRWWDTDNDDLLGNSKKQYTELNKTELDLKWTELENVLLSMNLPVYRISCSTDPRLGGPVGGSGARSTGNKAEDMIDKFTDSYNLWCVR